MAPSRKVMKTMAKRLHIGGLNSATNENSLRGAFTEFGEIVEAKVITDRDTGESRGFGFVSFTEESSGTAAIGARNDSQLDGSKIAVSEAKPRPSGARDGVGQ